jgi:hypothetical protein
MRLKQFIMLQFSEADATPSNNRVMIFLFLSTVMVMVLFATFAPLFGKVITLPNIPPSFETFVEIIVATLTTGVAVGKGITAYKEKAPALPQGATDANNTTITVNPPQG